MYTTQKEIRRAFWQEYPKANRKRMKNGDYCTETRILFNDFIEHLRCLGEITENMAYKVTL